MTQDNSKYVDPTPRCEICDWPLYATVQYGCTARSCSYRPPDGSAEHVRIQARKASLVTEKASVSKTEAISELLSSIISECQEALRYHNDKNSGGQHVTFTGAFANCTPSNLKTLMQWRRDALAVWALPDDPPGERTVANEAIAQLHDMTKRAEKAEANFKILEDSYVRTVLNSPLIVRTDIVWTELLWEWALRYGYAVEEKVRAAHAEGLAKPAGYIYMKPLLDAVGPPPTGPADPQAAYDGTWAELVALCSQPDTDTLIRCETESGDRFLVDAEDVREFVEKASQNAVQAK